MANYQFNNLPDKRTQLQYLQTDQKSRGSDDILMPLLSLVLLRDSHYIEI